jgi:ribosomal protein S18 acetylase RimI-like enzyme
VTLAEGRATAGAATIRSLRPSDYAPIIAVIDDWWGGQPMASMLPRMFFEHFADTSHAAEADGSLAGFLVGFCSQSRAREAYIHFVGVHPRQRGRGLGRRLYEAFFASAAARHCVLVRAITAPANAGSLAFHRRMGFRIEAGNRMRDGIAFTADYDGPGKDRVQFVRHLNPLPETEPDHRPRMPGVEA